MVKLYCYDLVILSGFNSPAEAFYNLIIPLESVQRLKIFNPEGMKGR